jgi:glycosyltransferase involved in cell wall biosynthesis
MSKKIVFNIGPDRDVMGGISSVINTYCDSTALNQKYNIIRIASHRDGSKIYKFLVAIKAYIKFIYLLFRHINCDKIVHLHVSSNASYFRKSVFFYIAKLFNCKIIFHIHAGKFIKFYNNSKLLIRRNISFILNHSNLIISLSHNWKNYLLNSNITNNRKIFVLPNPINTCAYKQSDLKTLNILFLGRLGKNKGTYDILKIIPKVVESNPNVRFLFAGDGDVKAIAEQAFKDKIDKNVKLLGWVSGNQKYELLGSGYMLLLPSYYESFGISIIEAMASGMPVIASNVGAIPEIIKHGYNGFIIEPGDIDGLYKYIMLLLANKELAQQMGTRNYKEARDKYDVNVVIEKLIDIYDAI